MDGNHQHFSASLYEAKEQARITDSQIGAIQRDTEVARIDFTGKDALLREKLDK